LITKAEGQRTFPSVTSKKAASFSLSFRPQPHFKHAKKGKVVVILKAREPARIMVAIGAEERWHLQLAQRWIVQYNFYINDQRWGRMFVRICPYLPFSARVCLNQHHWLANRMRVEGIDFKQCSNAFLKCSHPQKLQQLADSLTPNDLLSCGQKWLACLTPFFKESERKSCGCSASALLLSSRIL